MLGTPDYTVNYSVLGFYPVTDTQAEQLVNDWASTLGSDGWDQIRSMPLGPIAGVMIDGSYWNLSIEGDLSSNGQAYIYVYAAANNPLAATAPVNNSAQSFNSIQTIASDTAAANAAVGTSALDLLLAWLKSLTTPILLGAGAVVALILYSDYESKKR